MIIKLLNKITIESKYNRPFFELLSKRNIRVFRLTAFYFAIGAILETLIVLQMPNFIRQFQNDQLGTSLDPIFIFALLSLLVVSTYAIRLALIYLSNKLSFKIGSNFADELYEKLKNLPIREAEVFDQTIVVSNMTKNIDIFISHCIAPRLGVINGSLSLLLLSFAALHINAAITLYFALIIIVAYVYILKVFSKKSRHLGVRNVEYNTALIKKISFTFQYFIEICLHNAWQKHNQEFSINNHQSRQAAANSLTLAMAPRYIIECYLIIMGAIGLYLNQRFFNYEIELAEILTMLLVAQKLLPTANQLVSHLVAMKHGEKAIKSLAEFEDLVTPRRQKRHVISYIFKQSQSDVIVVNDFGKGASFLRQSKSPICIPMRAWTVILGDSGRGKTTLLSTISGLNDFGSSVVYPATQPDDNLIYIQSQLSYISQNDRRELAIHQVRQLLENDFGQDNASNIYKAFDIDTKDFHPDKNNIVSGGERQRFALLRELSRQPKILIMDEATNALGGKLENNIFNIIQTFWPKLTVIAVSHSDANLEFFQHRINL